MHYAILKNALVLGLAAFSNAQFMKRDEYFKVSAGKALEHIDSVRSRYPDGLSDAQEATLDFAKDVVNNFATDKIPELKEKCNDAFSEDECLTVLGDDSPKFRERGLDQRNTRTCECSTGANYCGGGAPCVTPANGSRDCNYQSRGCGDLFLMYCNGLCNN